jgi:uncharacterized UPF0160 family protein
VKTGSNTFTVTLRVVGGGEKGSLKSETAGIVQSLLVMGYGLDGRSFVHSSKYSKVVPVLN